ncbi:hypothetical protein P7C70_g6653, partial [Phenoliferia sp. Uapishka_3]
MLRRITNGCSACRQLSFAGPSSASFSRRASPTQSDSTTADQRRWASSTRATLAAARSQRHPDGLKSLQDHAGWKGKGRVLGTAGHGTPPTIELAKRQGYRLASTQSTPPTPPTSSAPKPVIYAHEDLLTNTARQDEAENVPPSTSPLVTVFSPVPEPLPPTVLSNGLPNPLIRWRPRPNPTLADDLTQYQKLAKARLTVLVTLTAMAGYAMCPLDPTSATAAMDAFAQSLQLTLPPGAAIDIPHLPSTAPSDTAFSNLVLAPVTVGVALCSASAASFNQLVEAPYDAQMARTRGRPLPRRYMTPLNAATFGGITGVVGLGTLYAINPLCATIGLATILLYCPIYTITKRHSIYNTWLGAVVGGLPPLLGWAACTDSIDPLTQPGAWAMFAVLFFWQFPHFNALSHTVRASYASSGYRMLSVLDPPHNALVALRYSAAMIPLAFAFPALGMTNAIFPWLAMIPNGAMTWAAWRFWRKRSERNAKVLFWASLGHLSLFLVFAMACKKGLWEKWTAKDEEEVVSEEVSAGVLGRS